MSRKRKALYALFIIGLLVGTIYLMYEFEIFGVDEVIDNTTEYFFPYEMPVFNTTEKPLKFYADALGIDIGTAVHHYTWKLSKDKAVYSNLLTSEFNMMSYEYVISMEAMWLGPNDYNFDWADDIAQFASDNNMTLRGSHLVWYDTIPDWLKSNKYSSTEVEDLIKGYIKDVIDHYNTNFPGIITEWNVANEVVNNDDDSLDLYRNEFLVGKIGTDWVKKVFQWARDADPNATLLLNEYDMFGIEEDIGIKVDKTYQVVSELNNLGLIDGVGFQGHLSLEYENNWTYNADVMKKFTDLNLTVAITELDIRINGDGKGISDSKLQTQADMYTEVFKMCLDNSLCSGITTWGALDKYHYTNRRGGSDWPLLFDFDYNRKIAYYSVQSLLEERYQNM